MQLHQIKPIHRKKRVKRVGRGGKRGTYSGRGLKGQNARSGRRFKPAIRELIKRYPKLRGYRFVVREDGVCAVNLDILNKKFSAGETVSPQTLYEKKVISRFKGNLPEIKILGDGDLTKKLVFEDCQFSKNAGEKVKKAGGTIKNEI